MKFYRSCVSLGYLTTDGYLDPIFNKGILKKVNAIGRRV